jgi:hypothetical protein
MQALKSALALACGMGLLLSVPVDRAEAAARGQRTKASDTSPGGISVGTRRGRLRSWLPRVHKGRRVSYALKRRFDRRNVSCFGGLACQETS